MQQAVFDMNRILSTLGMPAQAASLQPSGGRVVSDQAADSPAFAALLDKIVMRQMQLLGGLPKDLPAALGGGNGVELSHGSLSGGRFVAEEVGLEAIGAGQIHGGVPGMAPRQGVWKRSAVVTAGANETGLSFLGEQAAAEPVGSGLQSSSVREVYSSFGSSETQQGVSERGLQAKTAGSLPEVMSVPPAASGLVQHEPDFRAIPRPSVAVGSGGEELNSLPGGEPEN